MRSFVIMYARYKGRCFYAHVFIWIWLTPTTHALAKSSLRKWNSKFFYLSRCSAVLSDKIGGVISFTIIAFVAYLCFLIKTRRATGSADRRDSGLALLLILEPTESSLSYFTTIGYLHSLQEFCYLFKCPNWQDGSIIWFIKYVFARAYLHCWTYLSYYAIKYCVSHAFQILSEMERGPDRYLHKKFKKQLTLELSRSQDAVAKEETENAVPKLSTNAASPSSTSKSSISNGPTWGGGEPDEASPFSTAASTCISHVIPKSSRVEYQAAATTNFDIKFNVVFSESNAHSTASAPSSISDDTVTYSKQYVTSKLVSVEKAADISAVVSTRDRELQVNIQS